MSERKSTKRASSGQKEKLVDARDLTLDQWLSLLNSTKEGDLLFVSYCFPDVKKREEYLQTIRSRTDEEVVDLVRAFLIEGGSLGCDDGAYFNLIKMERTNKEGFDEAMKLEHYRRLYREYPALLKGKTPMIWQGNTWILDLLPEKPQLALDVLHAYLIAHFWFLPDGRIDGIKDAMTLIRAKFIETPQSALLSSLNPSHFEYLVDALYTIMGYTTTLTQRTYDKGRDVIAEKKHLGEKQRLLIQCKRTQKNVGVKETRALLGVVSNEKATKGVLVSTSEFTSEARKFEKDNRRLELIGNKDLQMLLNKYFGPKWPTYVDSIIARSSAKKRNSAR